MKLIEEEKYTDNVEPKFHEGDWVIGRATNNEPRQITEIKEEGYKTTYGGWIGFSFEEDMRLWTIQDAKAGDVLVSESTCGLGTWYCIFKSLDGDESMTVYCYLARDGRFETKKELCFDKDPYNTKPATKEQRDTLLKAMADAGYTFDFEKKELKKIFAPIFHIGDRVRYKGHSCDGVITEITDTNYICGDAKLPISTQDKLELVDQNLAWSEEDENMLEYALDMIEWYSGKNEDKSRLVSGWLKALKDRVRPKQKWSEENNRMCKAIIDNIQAICEEGYFVGNIDSDELIKWLKSLKERYTWKPSDKQMDALNDVISSRDIKYDVLSELWKELKKLKEE